MTCTLACALLLPAAGAQAAVTRGASFGTSLDVGGMKVGGEFQSWASATHTASDFNTSAFGSASTDGFMLHALAWTSENPKLPAYCTVYTCSWQTFASVTVWDSITLVAPANGQAERFEYDFTIDGTRKRGPWAYGQGTTATAFYSFSTDGNAWFQPKSVTLPSGVTEIKGAFMAQPGQNLTLYLMGGLSVSARSGAVADYSHTMAFHMTLPQGWTYTSASGHFAPAPSPVPEPASLALMLGGVAGLGLLTRRRGLAVRA
ncbi:PEP-CTERM sorting domain-containing protein [Ideonella sp. DXS22W]|uniref:PEP-CTERM sorting domain-containing protein n=1 Tax=Pseudaquabacterium inlustre TaxID=2984192 RepID=A0ABU9CF16_9BURK